MVKIAAISGYKPYELGVFKQNHPGIEYIKIALNKVLIPLIEDGLEWVIISGQLGVELWAAEVVFDLQEKHPDLKLSVFTPFLNQEDSWKEENKEWYESILARADHVDSISKKPYEKPWQFRMKNQFLIDKSDCLILLYDSEKEGSPKFIYETAISYQDANPFEIRLITMYDLQMIAEEEELRKQGF